MSAFETTTIQDLLLTKPPILLKGIVSGDENFFEGALKKKFRTHVIKLDIAPKSYPPGQYLLVSASNYMLYYLSQWDKIRKTCVVNLMSQDTKFWLFKINWARIRTHNLQDNTLILYQCATVTLFKFCRLGISTARYPSSFHFWWLPRESRTRGEMGSQCTALPEGCCLGHILENLANLLTSLIHWRCVCHILLDSWLWSLAGIWQLWTV